MTISPYLNFDGTCEEAFTFYAQCLGGRILGLYRHEDIPDADIPAEWRQKVMHVSMQIGDDVLMGSDGMPQHYQKPQGFFVQMGFKTGAEAERTFKALSAGATIIMPIAETFWSDRFGMLIDRFGIPWMINGGERQVEKRA